MSTVTDIAHAIERLSADDARALREWFFKRDAEEWDRQFEHDASAGRLDALAEEALRDSREGRCRDL